MIPYERWKDLLKEEALPVAILDLDAFDRNVASLAERARESNAEVRLRIASKSIRCPDLIRRVLDRGEPYQGIMAYSAAEAYELWKLGFDDFLVAYPTLRKSDLEALRAIHAGGGRCSLVCDSPEGVEAAADAFHGGARKFPLLLEFDVSVRLAGQHLGARRSPLRDVESVLNLARSIRTHSAIDFGGIMAYEAFVAGVADANPFARMMNPTIRFLQALSKPAVLKKRALLKEALEAEGFNVALFNGGGTGDSAWAAGDPSLTEVAVGSGFYFPHYFGYFRSLELEPSLFFALQMVRRPDPGQATLQGGGYIASGATGGDRSPIPVLPEGLSLDPNEGAGEVQTPVHGRSLDALQIGDPVLFRHTKAGEMLERFKDVRLFNESGPAGTSKSYRGHGFCFF